MWKWKYCFLFFPLFKKGMSTFVFFTGCTGYGICMHSLSMSFGERVVTQGKNNTEKCLSCTAVFQTRCRQLKLYLSPLPHDKNGVWYEEQNPSIYLLLVQISPILVFTSLASPCDLPFGCLTYRPLCSDSHAPFLPFPCFWLPRDVSFSLETRNNCNPCGNQEYQPHCLTGEMGLSSS